MSNVKLIIEERASKIGDFIVGRLLPFREKRMVGPFCFIDHMGPEKLSADESLDIGPHPHIGLSTLTYLFEGNIQHKDSLGSDLEIKPGQVNWMTAGKGIVHSERTPDYLRNKEKSIHGLQIWVALPKHLEEMEPSFYHADAHELPSWNVAGCTIKLVAGKVMGYESPVPVHSDLYFLEIKSTERSTLNLGEDLFGESGIYILEGTVESDGNEFGPKQLLIANNSKLCSFTMQANTSIYIFGGEPFDEERFIYWNFVASDREKIELAKQKWIEQSFDPVPGETDFVPLPDSK